MPDLFPLAGLIHVAVYITFIFNFLTKLYLIFFSLLLTSFSANEPVCCFYPLAWVNGAAVGVGVCHVTIFLGRCEQLFSHLDRELRSQNRNTTKVQRGELMSFIGVYS